MKSIVNKIRNKVLTKNTAQSNLKHIERDRFSNSLKEIPEGKDSKQKRDNSQQNKNIQNFCSKN